MPAHLKRKCPAKEEDEEVHARRPAPAARAPAVTAAPEGPLRRATRASSIPPVQAPADPEPRRRRRNIDANAQVPKSPRGKENIPEQPQPQQPQQPQLKPARATRACRAPSPVSVSASAGGSSQARAAPKPRPAPRDSDSSSSAPAPTATSRWSSQQRVAGPSMLPQQQQSGSVSRSTHMFTTAPTAPPSSAAAAVNGASGGQASTAGSVEARSDRNIDKVVLGNICFRAWYPSYYGKEVLGDLSAGGKGTKNNSSNTNGANGHSGSKNNGPNGGKTHGRRGADNSQPILDRLYVCPCCFKYSKELVAWWEHVQICERKGFIPGTKIYTHPKGKRTVLVPAGPAPKQGRGRRAANAYPKLVEQEVHDEGEWSVWEVDGEEDTLFCQNLSLFAKLFLDTKSVFFNVTDFKYYLLVYTPPSRPANPDTPNAKLIQPRGQIVGFFSKEKLSWDQNNLACILIFPPWQRKGLGSLLMGISYEISRREGLIGGPEKPISDLGKKGYKRFWAGEIARWLLSLPSQQQQQQRAATAPSPDADADPVALPVGPAYGDGDKFLITITDISQATWIAPDDCLAVLREMGVAEDAGMGPAPAPRRYYHHHAAPHAAVVGADDDTVPVAASVGPASASASLSSCPASATGTSAAATSVPHFNGGPAENMMMTSSTTPREVPRVKISLGAVRAWIEKHRINLERTCDPGGFIEGYGWAKKDKDVVVGGTEQE
ncbi:uncharacterized protein CTHT_0016440 [Thermochaetoides thermophila DSM 1495]|uniref:histone acetyltransferase n=1 Tax=Chaetomium thermophilum (strain DSM 1495 / CBS 144.50 / IMI 039719) TaxID=759272 RepID=G0S295_CHATD|nr:hypothetical protein CTHT_0016440 [Thermochaetoides thermophila DSM 1495]EGS22128.1 hypothetical protein CTHT_0016440 [Thermochaetoides thermophila DSM 1495]